MKNLKNILFISFTLFFYIFLLSYRNSRELFYNNLIHQKPHEFSGTKDNKKWMYKILNSKNEYILLNIFYKNNYTKIYIKYHFDYKNRTTINNNYEIIINGIYNYEIISFEKIMLCNGKYYTGVLTLRYKIGEYYRYSRIFINLNGDGKANYFNGPDAGEAGYGPYDIIRYLRWIKISCNSDFISIN